MPKDSSGPSPEELSVVRRLLKGGKLDALLCEHGWTRRQQNNAGKGKGSGVSGGTNKTVVDKEKPKTTAGWVVFNPKKKAEPVVPPQKDVLLQTGFSVEVRDGVDQLLARGGGVCLASSSEGEKALKEVQSTVPCAVLCP